MDKVRKVYNEIRITDLTPFQSRSNDSWITSKVKGKMYGTKDFDGSRVKVVTENGTVYLMGLVTQEQGVHAAELARTVEGVTRVVKLFEYVQPREEKPATGQSV
jgi:osmotically-inducible protein OsmY